MTDGDFSTVDHESITAETLVSFLWVIKSCFSQNSGPRFRSSCVLGNLRPNDQARVMLRYILEQRSQMLDRSSCSYCIPPAAPSALARGSGPILFPRYQLTTSRSVSSTGRNRIPSSRSVFELSNRVRSRS